MPFVIFNDDVIDFKCQCEITEQQAKDIRLSKVSKVIDERDPSLPERPLNYSLWPEYKPDYWGDRKNGHA